MITIVIRVFVNEVFVAELLGTTTDNYTTKEFMCAQLSNGFMKVQII